MKTDLIFKDEHYKSDRKSRLEPRNTPNTRNPRLPLNSASSRYCSFQKRTSANSLRSG